MFAQIDKTALTKRYLALCSLVVCAAGLLAWFLPGQLALTTPIGRFDLFILLTAVYAVLIMVIGLHYAGIQARYVFNLLLIAGTSGCVLHITVSVALLLPNHTLVWDDALMFMRYVHNLRTYGILAWNITDGPVYGPTEFLYVWLLGFISLFIGLEAPQLTLQLASSISGFVFLALTGVMVWRVVRLNVTGKLLILFLIFFGLAGHIPSLNSHFVTGMGTTFVLAHLMAYLLLLHQYQRSSSRWILVVTGIWGGLAYFARPDLLLFSTIIPLLLFVFARNRADRWWAFALGSLTLVVILAQLWLAQIAFGSALPLSFYVKSTNLYGGSFIYALHEKLPAEQLAIFLHNNLFYGLLLLVCMLFLLRTLQRWGVVGSGAAIAAILLVLYYRFLVMQVMYFFQRFYYPALPVILYLVTLSLSALLENLLRRFPVLPRITWLICATLIALALVGGCLYYPADFFQKARLAFDPHRNMLYQPSREDSGKHWSRHWFEIWAFSQLSPDMVMATTEVGLPSVINDEWYVYDLSGLNNTRLALHGFSADDVFAKQPDLIYMPWGEYTEMLKAIRNHPVFQADYELYSGWDLPSPFDIAIRKSSPYYQHMVNIITLGIQKRLPKSSYPD